MLPPTFREQVLTGYRFAKPQIRLMPSVFLSEELQRFQNRTLLLIGDKEVIYPTDQAIANAKNKILSQE